MILSKHFLSNRELTAQSVLVHNRGQIKILIVFLKMNANKMTLDKGSYLLIELFYNHMNLSD
jgi:hypothetical protein